MEKRIQIDSVDGYLHMDDLPHDCIFNKVVTGCGGTTVALKNDEDYVIAVPTTELIINKIGIPDAGVGIVRFSDGKSRPVYGLHGKYAPYMERDILDYVASNETRKIICTYDKLPKLCEIINPNKFRLLVDEYHRLLKDYSYRERAIDGVLNNFRRFMSFCFMSATPIQPLFKPSCLEDVDDVIAEWEHKEKLKVKLLQTNKPYTIAANIIKKYLNNGYVTVNGIKSHEAYFFINSVTDIVAIMEHCHLSNDEVRIICAKNDENEKKLKGYKISNSLSDSKRFNFITSKSFEGADYYNDTGICYVVSSASNKHTLASIDSDIP
jgi:transcription antitermination factor NusG